MDTPSQSLRSLLIVDISRLIYASQHVLSFTRLHSLLLSRLTPLTPTIEHSRVDPDNFPPSP